MNETLTKIVERVRQVAAERPDNEYKGVPLGQPRSGICGYTFGTCSDGTVGCIFGQVLQEFPEIELPDESNEDECLNQCIWDVLETNLRLNPDDKETNEALTWCQDIQENQDAGQSWESAVKNADDTGYEYTPWPGGNWN